MSERRRAAKVDFAHPDWIFSGKASERMWHLINTAKNTRDMQEAVYVVCCRLQTFEHELAVAGLIKRSGRAGRSR